MRRNKQLGIVGGNPNCDHRWQTISKAGASGVTGLVGGRRRTIRKRRCRCGATQVKVTRQ